MKKNNLETQPENLSAAMNRRNFLGVAASLAALASAPAGIAGGLYGLRVIREK